MVLPPVVLLAGGVVPVVGAVPPAGVVFTGHGDAEAAPVAPLEACALVVAPGALELRFTALALAPAGDAPELPGLAAVPGPVPAVVEGTHVTGAMPVGLALPMPLLVAPGAGVVPPGVCVIGCPAPGVAVPVVPTL